MPTLAIKASIIIGKKILHLSIRSSKPGLIYSKHFTSKLLLNLLTKAFNSGYPYISHNKKQRIRNNKRAMRCNITKQKTQNIANTLGDALLTSGAKKTEKKKLVKRSTSCNSDYDEANILCKNLQDRKFTNLSIRDGSVTKRRISYCQVVNVFTNQSPN